MLVKLLIIVAFIGLVLYVALPRRHAPPRAPRAGRLMPALLAGAAVLLFILALFCALLWLGGISGLVAGGDPLGGGSSLLRIAALLLLLSIVCAITALMKWPPR